MEIVQIKSTVIYATVIPVTQEKIVSQVKIKSFDKLLSVVKIINFCLFFKLYKQKLFVETESYFTSKLKHFLAFLK